jgi:hypothetical protein
VCVCVWGGGGGGGETGGAEEKGCWLQRCGMFHYFFFSSVTTHIPKPRPRAHTQQLCSYS